MSARTVYFETVKNDDGTTTVREETLITPATKKETAIAYSLLGGLIIAPFAPLVAIIVIDKWEARKARKAEAQKLKSV